MAKISLFPKLLFVFINLNLFFLIKSDETKEDPTLKALSCIKIINKNFKIEDPTSPNDFQLILACYSLITNEQSTKVLESGPEALTNEEVMNLSDNYLLKNIPDNESSKSCNNILTIYKYLSNMNKSYLSNDDYIKLFYNSKNSGLNKNFSLNVIYTKRKSKSMK